MGRYQSGQMGRAVNPLRKRFGGSNPSLPMFSAGIAQLVERQPSKLNVAGSSPVSRSLCSREAQVAQSVEHVLGKDGVTSSILVLGFFAIDQRPGGAIFFAASAGAAAAGLKEGENARDHHIAVFGMQAEELFHHAQQENQNRTASDQQVLPLLQKTCVSQGSQVGQSGKRKTTGRNEKTGE